MNNVIIEGTLVTDPELWFTLDGNVAAIFSISNIEKVDNYKKINYFTVAMWGEKGEDFAIYTNKGDKVLIYGKLKNSTYYKGKINKKVTGIVADEITIIRECDCPYKKSCHPQRQQLQVEIREENKSTIEKCPFYKELKDLYENK